MGRIILTILGAILAIGLIFTAIGWVFAMLKTFIIIALIAVVVFIVLSLTSLITPHPAAAPARGGTRRARQP
jgi:hypothetical protein